MSASTVSANKELRIILRSARHLLSEIIEEDIQFDSPTATRVPQEPSLNSPSRHNTEIDSETLKEIRVSMGECTRCTLSKERTKIVFGTGHPEAALMFIGEGPGAQEDLSGLPFVGRAGELLTNMIEKGLGIARDSVYICNIVKCRPPGNRNPLADEVEACRPFLDRQIASVQPKVIVTLGKPASSLLLGHNVAITKVRGTWHNYHDIPVMPTFHPAYVLRRYTEEIRRLVWSDLKAALKRTETNT